MKVIIEIRDGVINVASCSENIQILVRDYDVDDVPEEDLIKDETGTYVETEYL